MNEFNNQNNAVNSTNEENVVPAIDSMVMPTTNNVETQPTETNAPIMENMQAPTVDTTVNANPNAIFSEGPTMPGDVNSLLPEENNNPAPVTPTVEPIMPTENEPKSKTMLPILLGVIIVILAAGLVYYAFIREDNCPEEKECPAQEPCPTVDEDKIIADYNEKVEFIKLAKQFVDSAEKKWNSGKVTCQNQYAISSTTNTTSSSTTTDTTTNATSSSTTTDTTTNTSSSTKNADIPFVLPKKLAKLDQYGSEAMYYIFIDTENKNEVDLGVKTDKKIAGWVRFGINGEVYAAISDGTYYLVDNASDPIEFKDVTYKNIVLTGNGNNYQYKNNTILGSNTGGTGWAIGDYAIVTDGDDENDGIYMINGYKDSGWTPYCK